MTEKVLWDDAVRQQETKAGAEDGGDSARMERRKLFKQFAREFGSPNFWERRADVIKEKWFVHQNNVKKNYKLTFFVSVKEQSRREKRFK